MGNYSRPVECITVANRKVALHTTSSVLQYLFGIQWTTSSVSMKLVSLPVGSRPIGSVFVPPSGHSWKLSPAEHRDQTLILNNSSCCQRAHTTHSCSRLMEKAFRDHTVAESVFAITADETPAGFVLLRRFQMLDEVFIYGVCLNFWQQRSQSKLFVSHSERIFVIAHVGLDVTTMQGKIFPVLLD